MTTNYLPQDASAKKVSKTLSAKQSTKDLTNWDVERYVHRHHLAFYKGNIAAWVFSREIAEYFSPERGGYAFPSIPVLAEKLFMSERTIKRYIDAMREVVDANGQPLWNIVRGYKTPDGKTAANRYYPLFLEDILASLNGSDETDDGETLSPVDGVDEAGSDVVNAYDDDAMDTQSLDTDENSETVAGVHDLFDDTENVFAEPLGVAEPVEKQLSALDQLKRTYNLPAHYMQSDKAMYAKALACAKREKEDGVVNPYAQPPALDSESFKTLELTDRSFIRAFVRYLMFLGNVPQESLNTAAESMVQQWEQEHSIGAEAFYLKFMSDYIKALPGLN